MRRFAKTERFGGSLRPAKRRAGLAANRRLVSGAGGRCWAAKGGNLPCNPAKVTNMLPEKLNACIIKEMETWASG